MNNKKTGETSPAFHAPTKKSGYIFMVLLFLMAASLHAETIVYHYDDNSNLTRADYSSGSTIEYSYDHIGNRLNRTITVPVQGLEIHVKTDTGTLLSGLRVYLFNETGSYLGINALTDADGNVFFDLPAEKTFKVRLDYLGHQYWSECLGAISNQIHDFIVPHQNVVVTIAGDYDNDLNYKEGVKVYLFTPAGSYTGVSRSADSLGRVIFNLPEQEYKVRADFMSRQYWSNIFSWTDQTISINEGMAEITVTNMGTALDGVHVYAFNSSGAYLGIHDISDENGQVSFRMPEGEYSFRADYFGNQYWSGNSTIISHVKNPVSLSTGGGDFTLTIEKDGADPLENINCYLFSESGAYLNEQGASSEQGTVDFSLADGTYKIRMDYMGYQFWTQSFTMPGISDLTFTIPHQDVCITVQGDDRADIEPRQGLNLYLFTPGGSYLSRHEISNDQGMAVFTLPEKAYIVRADYLSAQYWTDPFVWSDEIVTIHEGLVQVDMKQGVLPLEDVNVYVFSVNGVYLNNSDRTDSAGKATFRLPQGTYKFRGDYMGSQYWGTLAVTSHETNLLEINTGGGSFELTVEKAPGSPVSNTPVYLFNTSGNYLGTSEQTDAIGLAMFDLSDGDYKFRVDYMGYQFWSDLVQVPTQMSNTLTIPHQDTVITVNQTYGSDIIPLKDVRTYLFKGSGAFMGKNQVTNEKGMAIYNLPPEEYKIRADYMGRQYWSDNLTWENRVINIEYGQVILNVMSAGLEAENVPVYLFSTSGSYLGLNQKTDVWGNTQFFIPAGVYKFRIDHNGAQNWTDLVNVVPHEETNINMALP